MMYTSHKAFTMIELVFVIVVIGILSAIAIPKFAATRDDAVITRARDTVASLRSAIATERQKMILRGEFSDINGSTAAGLLEYELSADWTRSGDDFTFTLGSHSCKFTVTGNRLTRDSSNCDIAAMNDL